MIIPHATEGRGKVRIMGTSTNGPADPEELVIVRGNYQ